MEVPNSSSIKKDRKTIERNRRLQMKALYTKLDSLLPHSKEEVPFLMDRIEKTIEYIKHLEEKLRMLKERKESINRRERVSRFSSGAGTSSTSVVSLPNIQIHDLGSAMEVVVINSPGEKFAFYDIIVVLEEEGAEVLNASFWDLGDKVFYTVHSLVQELKPDFEVAKMMERMKGLFA
ncbi:hypothetical protein QJS04_geneDACA012858 [Acorus gramineus]|uniref:BHLH domain-containing protein n=1 Tax=Acorus gramineus TaxID=55184 RepID=A0AAV9BJ54_ACOGR|nr:hypothetical protein QJS04_geneDACA012858 [Acorus gramineus]